MTEPNPSIAWKAILDPRKRAAAMPDLDVVNELAEYARYTGDEADHDAHGAKRFYKAQEFVHILQEELLARLDGLRKVADASTRVQKAIMDISAKADAVDIENNAADIGFYIASLTGELQKAQEDLAKATIAYMAKP